MLRKKVPTTVTLFAESLATANVPYCHWKSFSGVLTKSKTGLMGRLIILLVFRLIISRSYSSLAAVIRGGCREPTSHGWKSLHRQNVSNVHGSKIAPGAPRCSLGFT